MDIQPNNAPMNNVPIMPEDHERKKLFISLGIIVAIIAVSVLGWWVSKGINNKASQPSQSSSNQTKTPSSDSMSEINQIINNTDLLNLDQEFKSVDNNINQLK